MVSQTRHLWTKPIHQFQPVLSGAFLYYQFYYYLPKFPVCLSTTILYSCVDFFGWGLMMLWYFLFSYRSFDQNTPETGIYR